MKTFRWISLIILFFATLIYYEVIPSGRLGLYCTSTPYVIFILPFLLVFALELYSSKRPLIPILVLILFSSIQFLIAGQEPLFTNTLFKANSQREPIRICSWNTAYFFEWGKADGFQRLRDAKCDIIVLQEVWKSQSIMSEITDLRDQYLPEFDIRASNEFVFLIPLTSDTATYTSTSEGYFGVDVSAKGSPITLVSVHVWNPIVPKPFLEGGTLMYKDAFQAREEQRTDLAAFLTERAKLDTPVIVVGDFNSMPNQTLVRNIDLIGSGKSRLIPVTRGAFQNPLTYSSTRRLIQIDHVFVSSSIRPLAKLNLSCKANASDHCLLILDVLL